MSDFHCEVVRLQNVGRHPNADTLSIADANGQPVIFRTGDYNEGDLAVYVPVDAIVPDKPEWAFLAGHRRIRAKRLRGVFSMGMLSPVLPGMELGQDVREAMGIEKYEPELATQRGGGAGKGGPITGGESEPDPGFLPEYTDIEGWRRWKKVLEIGEEVVLCEKIHGSNARFVYRDDRLWVGSRHQIKRNPNALNPDHRVIEYVTRDAERGERQGKVGPMLEANAHEWIARLRENAGEHFISAELRDAVATDYGTSTWWQVAVSLNLEERLAAIPNIAIYGEVYGQVQDLKYGLDTVELVLFDAMDTDTRRYLDYDAFLAIAVQIDLPTAPELYRGPWSEDLLALAEGETTLPSAAGAGKKNVREGFVVRPIKERFHAGYPNDAGHLRGGLGRVVLKHVGEGYLTRKGG